MIAESDGHPDADGDRDDQRPRLEYQRRRRERDAERPQQRLQTERGEHAEPEPDERREQPRQRRLDEHRAEQLAAAGADDRSSASSRVR